MNRKQRRKDSNLTTAQRRHDMRRMFISLGSLGLDMRDRIIARKVLLWQEYVRSINPKLEGIKEAHTQMLDYCANVKQEVEDVIGDLSAS